MYKGFNKSNSLANKVFGCSNRISNTFHITSSNKLPLAAQLKLPTNVVDINAAETGRFSPLRDRDISGPVINSHYGPNKSPIVIDITVQADQYASKYDCRGAVNLSSSMQSNVPSPFSGNHTHLNMPGSQWGQGNKYLSDHLHGAHYLTLRHEYRASLSQKATGTEKRSMSTDTKKTTSKEKLKTAIKEYGSTVIVFHVTISLISLGCCYLLVSSGVNMVEILHKLHIEEGALTELATSNTGTFVLAYAVHKIFAPVRIGITLTATPFIVRYLRKVGFLKKKM